jgi:metal-responsive CopG/Arc/MetJ family transcriptional regulator
MPATKTKTKKTSEIVTVSMNPELARLLKALELKTNTKRSTLIRNLIIDELKQHGLLDDDYSSNPKLGRPKKQ